MGDCCVRGVTIWRKLLGELKDNSFAYVSARVEEDFIESVLRDGFVAQVSHPRKTGAVVRGCARGSSPSRCF